MTDEIALVEEWAEVAVAETEEPLADEVRALVEKRKSAGETSIESQQKSIDWKVENQPLVRKQPLRVARDWDIQMGPVYGEAGTTTALVVAPQCYFRVEKTMATDSADVPGTGTAIGTILVGRRLQRPVDTWTLTRFFTNSAIASGNKWDTCQPAFSIAVNVSFIQSCTFDMVLFGKAAV